jgi:hypothetical protein
VEQGEKNRLEVSARIDSVKGGMENRLIEVGEYLSEIQDFITASRRYQINRLLSWLGAPYRITKNKKIRDL